MHDIDSGMFSDQSNLVMITHGLTLRIFLARWFHWTVEQFEATINPPNAQLLVMDGGVDGRRVLQREGRHAAHVERGVERAELDEPERLERGELGVRAVAAGQQQQLKRRSIAAPSLLLAPLSGWRSQPRSSSSTAAY